MRKAASPRIPSASNARKTGSHRQGQLEKVRVVFSACDAGSANYLLPILRQFSEPHMVFAQHVAGSKFTEAGIDFQYAPGGDWGELAELGDRILEKVSCDLVVSGTSWGPTIDKAIILAARKKKIPTISIIEHWNLYRERFSRLEKGVLFEPLAYLPDIVWVNDGFAKQEAIAAGLVEPEVLEAGQPHLESQLEKLCSFSDARANNEVVFVSERIGDDFVEGSPLYRGYDEFSSLEFLASALDFDRFDLRIKLHPQERSDKYDAMIGNGLKASILTECNIERLILESHKLVGMGSMLLLEAALVRDDIVSVMPGGNSSDFVGNVIGATKYAGTRTQLECYISAQRSLVWQCPFGLRFRGSTQRIMQMLAVSLAKSRYLRNG